MKCVVNLYLTWNCNFYCDHCIHECGPGGKHMTDEQLNYAVEFVRWAQKNNIPLHVLGLTGGEPTSHPKFWSDVIPKVINLKVEHKVPCVELHTNASIPVPEPYKAGCARLFDRIIVGHDMFHRQFKPLSELYLQDYTDIGVEVCLRQVKSIYCNECISPVRLKGRAAALPTSDKYELQTFIPGAFPIGDKYPQQQCSIYGPKVDYLLVAFTPDHINFCGEKSHPLNTGIDEGQFHKYGMPYDEILNNSLKYAMFHSRANCSQKCMVNFIRKKKVFTPLTVNFTPKEKA